MILIMAFCFCLFINLTVCVLITFIFRMTEKPEKPEKTVCMDNIVDDVENCFYSVKSKPIYTLSLFIF